MINLSSINLAGAGGTGGGGSIDDVLDLQIAATFTDEELPTLCGQPMILFGAGTPQEAVVPVNWKQFDPMTGRGYMWNGQPSAIGQQYIDTTASVNGRYIAVSDANNILTWKNF